MVPVQVLAIWVIRSRIAVRVFNRRQRSWGFLHRRFARAMRRFLPIVLPCGKGTIFPRCDPSLAKTLWSSAIRTTSSGPTRAGISECVSLSLIAFDSAISPSFLETVVKTFGVVAMFARPKADSPIRASAHYCSHINHPARPRRPDHLLREMTCGYSFTPALTKLWSRRIGGGRIIPPVSDRVERLEFCIFATQKDIWAINHPFPFGPSSFGFRFFLRSRGPWFWINGSRRLGRGPFILLVRIVGQLKVF